MWAKCRGALAMAEKRRLNLSFSMASPFQREAWERLCAIPAGQRTDTVCRAVCRMYEQESLLEAVRQMIREELHSVEIISAKEESEQAQAEDVFIYVPGLLRLFWFFFC